MVDKQKLLGYMVSNGYTQKSLAKEIGVSKNTLNNKINGHTAFDTSLIMQICNKLNIEDDAEKAQIFLTTSSRFGDKSLKSNSNKSA